MNKTQYNLHKKMRKQCACVRLITHFAAAIYALNETVRAYQLMEDAINNIQKTISKLKSE